MRKILSLLILTACTSIYALSQEVIVEAETDTSVIYIGDQVEYTVSIRQPSDIKLKVPVYNDTLSGNIEILSQSELDTVSLEDEVLQLIKTYRITSFDTGYYQIPPYYLEYETGQGKKRFYSDYVPLRVLRVNISPPDSTDVIFDRN